jgi:phosphatidylglycerophosphate synthase
LVNQRVGAHLARWARRRRLHPSALSLANLVLGVGTSVGVVVLAGSVASGTVPGWAVGVAALVLWHVAYSLDCADGQLARFTGRTSTAGARLDVLADAAVGISLAAALAATAVEHSSSVPTFMVVLLAGGWMVNVLTSVLQSGELAGSLVASTSPVVRLAKLPRDHSVVVTVCAFAVGFAPGSARWVIAFFAGFNCLFLALSIAAAARRSFAPQ